MSNIIAIGDIHGSAEWRNIMEENNDAMVVFLGDYLDPYGPYNRYDILNNLADIIELTKSIILYSHMPGYHISGLNVILKEILTETLLNN